MNEMIKRLEASIIEGRALHAYLLAGTDPDTTDGEARTLASLMLYGKKDAARLINDPDYLEYSGSVTIGEFRDTARPEIYRETYGRMGRVVVFLSANMLSPIVQNAMLKVLEEPPENTHFILTGNEYGILPTIRSRCMIVRCPAQDPGEAEFTLMEHGASEREARKYAVMSGGVTARALRLYEDEGFRTLREEAVAAFLSALDGAPDLKWSRTKRDRGDFMEANEMLLLVCHDMLRIKCGSPAEYNPDIAEKLKKSCSRFTIGEIGCIIDKLTDNAERLGTNAGGGACFDRLLAGVALIGAKRPAVNKKQI